MACTDATLTRMMWPYSLLVLTEIVVLLQRCQRTHSQCSVVVIFGLKRADCMDKGLVAIPRKMPVEINVLTFTGNLLAKLDMDDFRQYHSLQEIYLVRNRINNVAPDAFRGLHNLQILDLQGNKLTGVPVGAFQHLSSVRILVLKSNPIRYLTPDCFRALSNIEVLNFENCWLERVHPHAFRGLSKLNEINLVNNELRGLNSEMVDFLPPTITILRLYRNPWNCDCRLRWLRRWLSLGQINWDFASNSPTCFEPKLLSDISWRHLGSERFACPSVIVNTVTSVRVQLGTNVSVDCVVLGDPEPVVTWTRNAKSVPNSVVATTYESNEVGDKQVRSSVIIRNATKRDMGDYKCTADNSAGRSEVTYKVWTEEEEILSLVGNLTAIGRLRREEMVLLGVSVGAFVLVLTVIIVVVIVVRRSQERHQTYRIHGLKSARKNNGKNPKSEGGSDENSARSSRENTLLSETGSTGLLVESIEEDCDHAGQIHFRSPSDNDPPTTSSSSADAITSRCLQKFFSRLKDRKSSKDSPSPSSPIDVWFIKTEESGGGGGVGGGQCEFTPDILRCEMTTLLQASLLQSDVDCLPTIPEDDDVDDDVTCDVSDHINGSAIDEEGTVALTSFGARLNNRTVVAMTTTEGGKSDDARTKLGQMTSTFDPSSVTRDSFGMVHLATPSLGNDDDLPSDYKQPTENRTRDQTNSYSVPLSDTKSHPIIDSSVAMTSALFQDTTLNQATPLNRGRTPQNTDHGRATIAEGGHRSDKWINGTHIRPRAGSAGGPDGAAIEFPEKSWGSVRRAILMEPSDKNVEGGTGEVDGSAQQHDRDINNDCNCDYEAGFSIRPMAEKEGGGSGEEEEEEEGEEEWSGGARPKPGQRDAFGTTV